MNDNESADREDLTGDQTDPPAPSQAARAHSTPVPELQLMPVESGSPGGAVGPIDRHGSPGGRHGPAIDPYGSLVDHSAAIDSEADTGVMSAIVSSPVKVSYGRPPSYHDDQYEDDPSQIRRSFALWGAVSSGKTVFLQALPIAVAGDLQVEGDWIAFDDSPSAQLHDEANRMALEGVLPQATFRNQESMHRWRLQGRIARQPTRWQALRGRKLVPKLIDIQITVVDRGGGTFLDLAELEDERRVGLLESSGFIYLFDPTLERESRKENYRYFVKLMAALNRYYEGNVQKHIAVCVAKFDDAKVFIPSLEAGWVNQDPSGVRQLRVLDRHAKPYFKWLCHRLGTLELYNEIDRSFGKRAKYYVSTAFGFHIHNGQVHPSDYSRFVETQSGIQLRGAMNPVNVAEPFINMDMDIAEDLA